MKMNAKAAVHKIFTQNKFVHKRSDTRPNYLKKYPNMNFNRNKIINFVYKVKGKIDFGDGSQLPKKLEFTKMRIPTKLKEVL
jgi:hypothetical protein